MIYDFCIIGGGIVGLSSGLAILEKYPGASLLLIEKESAFALHQTGHNSGVIHAGIYYAPGSLKARLCREGLTATIDFCKDHGINYDQCGKLIVATNGLEDQRVEALSERATANGLALERLSAGALLEREPNISGTSAIFSPQTAIVDYPAIARKMAALLEAQGATLLLDRKVDRINEKSQHVEIGAAGELWQANKLVVCAGLQADRLARLAGLSVDFQIVPFRGEYFRLPPEKNQIVRHLIYPAPDPALPFLGVHLTRMIDGSVTVGPNAVLGFAREGYPSLSFDALDFATYLGFPGFWKLLWAYRKNVLQELKGSLSRRTYLQNCRKYCPSLTLDDLLPHRAGIRAQLVLRDGSVVHDFLFRETDRMLHVCNAPSPAATSALPIGRMIADAV